VTRNGMVDGDCPTSRGCFANDDKQHTQHTPQQPGSTPRRSPFLTATTRKTFSQRNQPNKPVETRRITYFENRQTTDNTNQPDSRPLSNQPILNEIVTKTSKKTTPIIILPAKRNNNNRGATKFPLTSPIKSTS
jgi:hypothetical protein